MLPASSRVAEVVSALSQALDLGSGSTAWHSVRTCILGMRIAAELHLPEEVRNHLYYALLLKDAGSSDSAFQIYNALAHGENASRLDLENREWAGLSWEKLQNALAEVAPGKHISERAAAILKLGSQQRRDTREVITIRCERGATLARLMGLSEQTAGGIEALDEHWDGQGNPRGLRGEQIPVASRIMLLAQTLDVFFTSAGPDAALSAIAQQSRRSLDPDCVKAAQSLARRGELWVDLARVNSPRIVLQMAPRQKTAAAGRVSLDAICQAFATIVDAKSPFTFNHSNGVANAAVTIAKKLELDDSQILLVRHAALLHDLGKMAVSNTILQKAGELNHAEWQSILSHPKHTWGILRSISGFEKMSEIAAAHHERLDGTGYFRGFSGRELPLEARILAVADIFDALSASRPYRDAIPPEKVLAIIRKGSPHAFDAACLEALEQSGMSFDQTFRDISSFQKHLAVSVNPSLPGEPERESAAAAAAK